LIEKKMFGNTRWVNVSEFYVMVPVISAYLM
jgi:hypothetical protein